MNGNICCATCSNSRISSLPFQDDARVKASVTLGSRRTPKRKKKSVTTASSHRHRLLLHDDLVQPTHGEIIRKLSHDIYSLSDPGGTVTPRRFQSPLVETRYCTNMFVSSLVSGKSKAARKSSDGKSSRIPCRVEILVPLRDLVQVLLTPSFLSPSQAVSSVNPSFCSEEGQSELFWTLLRQKNCGPLFRHRLYRTFISGLQVGNMLQFWALCRILFYVMVTQ